MLTKGAIEIAASPDGLNVEIIQVKFTYNEIGNSCYWFKLICEHGDDDTLYKGETNNPCRIVSAGSKISFVWMTDVYMEDAYHKERLAAPLGTISIHWQSSSIELPEDLKIMRDDDLLGNYGPLKLCRPDLLHIVLGDRSVTLRVHHLRRKQNDYLTTYRLRSL